MRAATTVMDSHTKHQKEMSSGYPLLGELERSKKYTLTLTAVKVKWICVMLQTCGVPEKIVYRALTSTEGDLLYGRQLLSGLGPDI